MGISSLFRIPQHNYGKVAARMKRAICDSLDAESGQREIAVCNEPPCHHNAVLSACFNEHLELYHEHRCKECGKNLTNSHLLDLHFQELHNPFQHENTKLTCFEEDCACTFDRHCARIEHLKQVHQYSDTYNYEILQSGEEP